MADNTFEELGKVFNEVISNAFAKSWIPIYGIAGIGSFAYLIGKWLPNSGKTKIALQRFKSKYDSIELVKEIANQLQLVPTFVMPLLKKISPDIKLDDVSKKMDWVIDIIQAGLALSNWVGNIFDRVRG